jgi:pimeloyl-ACP methyl ester carboxylesterase
MHTAQANGIEIAYQVHGQGPPLVLISGVGYGAWFWHKLAPLLADDFQVITFDNRGGGGSDKPAGPYSVPMMANDTGDLLYELGIPRAHILGHSLGGFIAQEFAVQYPDMVDKLILASTNYGGTQVIPITPEAMEVLTNRQDDPVELVKRGIGIASAPGFADRHPDVVKELVDYRFTNPVPPEQYQAQVMAGAGMAAFTDEQVDERMAVIQAPTLILFGEHDMVVPPGNAELMAGKIANAEVKIIPGAGHIFAIEDPGRTATIIREFLNKGE